MPVAILIVDDNAVQASTRKAILSRSGNKVTVANSAAQALSLLSINDFAAGLGLVITDHLMPGMNGPQFVEALRCQLPDLPVLVLSGMPGAEVEYENLHVIYRLKPFAPEELLRLTQSISEDDLEWTA